MWRYVHRAVDGYGQVIDVYPPQGHRGAEKTDRIPTVIITGHAFIQNLRRGHYELGVDTRANCLRCAAAFDELATAI